MNLSPLFSAFYSGGTLAAQLATELPFQNVLLSHPAFFPLKTNEFPENLLMVPSGVTSPPAGSPEEADLAHKDAMGWNPNGLPVSGGSGTYVLGAHVLGGLRDSLGVDHFRTGTWHVAHEGVGSLSFSIDGVPVIASVSSSGGTTVYTVGIVGPIARGFGIRIDQSFGVDPVRSIRMVHQSNWDGTALDAKGTFDPDFVQALTDLSPKCLRVAKWKYIVESTVRHWTDELPVGYATYWEGPPCHRGGVPYEVLLELCELVGCDLWVNVPHRTVNDPNAATNGYMAGLGSVLSTWLTDPTHAWPQSVYLEYSNEIWNGTKPPSVYAKQKAAQFGLTGFLQGTGAWSAVASEHMYVQVTAAMDSAAAAKVRWILGGNLTDTYVGDMLSNLPGNAPTTPPTLNGALWGVAVAPYCFIITGLVPALGGPTLPNPWPNFVSTYAPTAGPSVMTFIADLSNLLMNDTAPFGAFAYTMQTQVDGVVKNALMAFNIMPVLVAYEGGQGLQATNTDCAGFYAADPTGPPVGSNCDQGLPSNELGRTQDLFKQANRHVDIHTVFYDRLVRYWEAMTRVNQPVGYPTLFNHFNFAQGYAAGRSGTWGYVEYVHPWPPAVLPPKFVAARDFDTP